MFRLPPGLPWLHSGVVVSVSVYALCRCMEMTVDFSVDDGEQQSQTFSLQSWGHPQQPSPSPASSSDSVLVGE